MNFACKISKKLKFTCFIEEIFIQLKKWSFLTQPQCYFIVPKDIERKSNGNIYIYTSLIRYSWPMVVRISIILVMCARLNGIES